MNAPSDPLGEHLGIILIQLQSPGTGTIVALIITILLLILSGLFSASEVAFFSLTPTDLEEIKSGREPANQRIISILEKPKRLLATILIANNIVNVAIVILSTTLINGLFSFEGDPKWLEFTIQVVAVTFVILLFGEVVPKIYANRYSKKVAAAMSGFILFMRKILWPMSQLLVSSSSLIDKRIKKRSNGMTVDELGHAFELTLKDEQTSTEERKILEGIVKFGNTDVKQIMQPRMDVIAFDVTTPYSKLIQLIIDSGFSRVPVYEGSLDKVVGLLYIKDLIPHLDESDTFNWQQLIREPFYVPENKKIDDLLKEFKDTKIHLAIVVDEYGAVQGIVTLEDVIEEIVGDITDEFDDVDISYTKIDDNNYVFEGKTKLLDLYKVLEIDGNVFDEAKGEAETLAGFLLEQSGKMPDKNDKLQFDSFIFTIEAVDKRRIKQVKITRIN